MAPRCANANGRLDALRRWSAPQVRDGVELAYRARGRGRLPAAAAPRLAGDEADLVAQHRAAGRGRLRGDRPRPARLRRLRPRAGRLLRPRPRTPATCTRWCTTCSATTRCAAAGGDVGGVVIQDLGLRFEGFVERQCLFNTVPPAAARRVRGGRASRRRSRATSRMAADYFLRQGRDADGLAAELDTPEQAPPLHRRSSTARASGRAGRVHRATTSTS